MGEIRFRHVGRSFDSLGYVSSYPRPWPSTSSCAGAADMYNAPDKTRRTPVTFLTVLAIALALAMDAFAVSVSASATLPVVTWRHYFRLSFHFGLFQFLMPVVGWALGVSVRSYIEAWDHWIAFGLLALVGVNMLREAWSGEEEESSSGDPSRGVAARHAGRGHQHRRHGRGTFLRHDRRFGVGARDRHRTRVRGRDRGGREAGAAARAARIFWAARFPCSADWCLSA